MTTLKDFIALLDGLGLPCTQMAWYPAQAPELPYSVLIPQKTKNGMADDRVYRESTPYLLELYTRFRDVPLEQRIQTAMNDAGVAWQRYHTSDPDGPVIIAVYSINLTEQ